MSTFSEIALTDFDFLEKEYSFIPEIVNDCRIKWKNANYFFELLYDFARSFEIDVRFAEINHDYPPFDLNELDVYAHQTNKRLCFQASNEERLRANISKISSIVHETCAKVNLFTPDSINNLLLQREILCREYAKKNTLAEIRKEAERAWNNKSYSKFIELVEPYRNELTTAENKKYQYCLTCIERDHSKREK